MNCSGCGSLVKEGMSVCGVCGTSVKIAPKSMNRNTVDNQPQYYQQQEYYQQYYSQPYYPQPAPYMEPKAAKEEKKGISTGVIVAIALVALILVVGVATVAIIFMSRGGGGDCSGLPVPEVTPEVEGAITAPEAVVKVDQPSAAPTPAVNPGAEEGVDTNQSSETDIVENITPGAEWCDPLDGESETFYGSDYMIPYSDTRYLTYDDLAGFSKDECRIARNEILARRGRKFRDAQLQEYFDSKSWYCGYIEPEAFNENQHLNEIERANMYFIKDYENNYERYH